MELEDDHRDEAVREIYSKVQTWGDLLYTNVAFLTNRMWGTYNYPGKFSSEDPTHAAESGKNIIDLNRLGIFTVTGQDSGCSTTSTARRFVGLEEVGPTYEQRGFVSGYVPQSMARPLVQRLQEDPRIYVRSMNFKTPHVVDTVPEEYVSATPGKRTFVFCITRDGSGAKKCQSQVARLEDAIKYEVEMLQYEAPNSVVYDLLRYDSVVVDVFMREWCTGSADAILLEHVRAMVGSS
jgi:hypothetical protein